MGPQRTPWYGGTFVRTALPMFGFVLVCWYGLDQLMSSKLKIRQSVRGYDKVEEYDPLERLRRLEGGGGGGKGSGGGKGGNGAPAAARGGGSAAAPGGGGAGGLSSLEEELAAMTRGVDIHNFEYKPVPRSNEDEE
ncbi:MAG: hypothetical protein J3K34DRAFT_523553 [Monoraphidium minutum]|nr:MAG: hypothetical protein J3K34DRAFT_523553 [Monoraphidium minutum]